MTLNDFIVRLRGLLFDPDGDLFSDEVLEENLRLALAEIQKINPLGLQIAGLDGALTTNLDGQENLLMRRARWLVLWQRLQARSEVYHPDPPGVDGMENFLTAEQQALDLVFDQLRLSYLQTSSVPPYAVWPEEDLN